MSQRNFGRAIQEYDLAMSEFFKGNVDPLKSVYSNREDISLAQLSGSFIRGRRQVIDTASRNATKYREGNTTFETLAQTETAELAYVFQIERTMAKIGGSDEVASLSLRVTSVFRREDGVWKLLHRHVDSAVK